MGQSCRIWVQVWTSVSQIHVTNLGKAPAMHVVDKLPILSDTVHASRANFAISLQLGHLRNVVF